MQQLRLHQGGNGNEINVPPEGTTPTISNNTSVLTSSTCHTTSGRNNSIPSFSRGLMGNSVDSSSLTKSSTIFSTGSGSNFSERAAAAKNRWKAKGSITQGHVPQRQMPSASLGSTSGNNNLKTLHTNLAHSHSFDDAFENGKGVSGSSQLLHRRHTHHR